MKRAMMLTLMIGFLGVHVNWLAGQEKLLVKETFMEMESVGSPAISPDGKLILFSRGWVDKINDRSRSNLWIVDVEGERVRELTHGNWSDSSPVWSPDGKRIAFISDRDGTSQIHVMWLDTREVAQLTHLEQGADSIKWSPDGKYLAFTQTLPDTEPILSVKLPKKPKGANWAAPAVIVDRLTWARDGRGPVPKGYSHIFVIDAELGGTPRQVTSGDYSHSDPQWSADGRKIYFSAIRKPEAEYLHGDSEIYAVDLETLEIPDFRPGPPEVAERRELAEAVFGPARSFLLGTPVGGFTNLARDDPRLHVGGGEDAALSITKAARLDRALGLPGDEHISEQNCSYFVGIWSADDASATEGSTIIFPCSMNASAPAAEHTKVTNLREEVLSLRDQLFEARANEKWARSQIEARDSLLSELRGKLALLERELRHVGLRAAAFEAEGEFIREQAARLRQEREQLQRDNEYQAGVIEEWRGYIKHVEQALEEAHRRIESSLGARVKRLIPRPIKQVVKRALGRPLADDRGSG